MGAVGSALAHALYRAGLHVTCLIDLDLSYITSLAASCKIEIASTRINELPRDLDIVIISVPDDKIIGVGNDLSQLADSLRYRSCLHTSGVYDKSVLSSISEKGIPVGSFHPLQTFPSREVLTQLDDVYFAIEGDDSVVNTTRDLVTKIGGKPIVLPQGTKPLYHLAAVTSANFIPVLQQAALDLLSSAGISEVDGLQMLRPLATSSLQNCFAMNPAKSLTGPVARGDFKTVETHKAVLRQKHPELLELYACLSNHAVDLALKKGADIELLNKIRTLLKSMDK
ncbi:DUF2520 domain-containing protein [bacterium]|nr:DUF2520 domain-containing protein [bacterium]